MELMGALGPGGDATALIAHLEAMASEFESQSGEPETEIRTKIAMLRSIIDSRPMAVAQSRARMESALQMAGSNSLAVGSETAQPEEDALPACTSSCLESIESNLEAVGSMLREDPAAAAMVANLVSKDP